MTRINNQEQQYQKPSAGAIFGGIFAGSMAQVAVSAVPVQVVTNKIMDRVKGLSNLSDDEFKQVNDGINKALKNTTLSNKGVTLLKIPTVKAKSFQEKLTDFLSSIKSVSKENSPYDTLKFILGELISPMKSIEEGTNAGYTFGDIPKMGIKAKTIIMPEKSLSLTTFHEIGHAANDNLSKIGKLLQKSRFPLMFVVTPLIGLVALCKTKKAPNQEPQGTMDKTTTFIKNNAGKLTFLASVPILIEEAMASIKGCKFAKEAGLSTELLAKITKTNKMTYLTYLGAMLLASLGIYLGVKVKDAIAKPTPVYQN